ncbi:MAG: phosphoribosylaminoimidazolesuccinocarboxamide synthase [Dehalococcoidia bacterium]|nr:phosphoribosylaminoimidazolesuccinocarboxamide synthase [Dehalococcoidia bacterium]|tara:strand:- start:2203 stop:3096 length:894 start_codon:yes stop_codon:yes gene_type:complete
MNNIVMRTELPAPVKRGKVRDTYDLGDKLLIVATDRISALDLILPTGISRKGEVLTRLSAWWFDRIGEVVPHHFIAVIDDSNAEDLVPFPLPPNCHGRSMLVRKAQRYDAECIMRGYISGSGWREYTRDGAVCGIKLPEGLTESDRLPDPIFTPSTKADVGHDENINFEQLEEIVGTEAANAMSKRSRAIYDYGHQVALERDIIIADTKFEFGLRNEETILIDEVLTPDSSRFWPLSEYQPGGSQPSFDKQPVRDWLAATGWTDGDPAPEIPGDVADATTDRYLTVYRTLTGEDLPA